MPPKITSTAAPPLLVISSRELLCVPHCPVVGLDCKQGSFVFTSTAGVVSVLGFEQCGSLSEAGCTVKVTSWFEMRLQYWLSPATDMNPAKLRMCPVVPSPRVIRIVALVL